jgi:hypothetical protein
MTDALPVRQPDLPDVPRSIPVDPVTLVRVRDALARLS